MRRRPPRSVEGRAITALIALAALWLNVLLGAVALQMAPQGPESALCAHEADPAADDAAPPCHQHACCTAAQAATLGAPQAAYAVLAWPVESRAPRARPTVASLGARAPPDPALGPRAPPAV